MGESDDWRRSNVIPIYKNGKMGEPGNYRPASLTSISGRILQQILRTALYKHLENKAVITRSQHGFVKNKACQTNLISFFKIGNLLDRRNPVYIIYLDFSKTFG